VDNTGTGHRLDHGADRLAIDLADPPGQGPPRVSVRRTGELVEMLAPIGQQTDIDLPPAQIQPSVQH
jgi:hypothetical protein